MKTNAEIWAPSPKPPLKVHIWNKIGNWLTFIGVLVPLSLAIQYAAHNPPRLTMEQLGYIFFFSFCLFALGVLIRSRGIWPYLLKTLRRESQ